MLQRQREVFLGFAVTVTAAVALQISKVPANGADSNLYLFVLAGAVAVSIATWLTWRSSREILKAGIYAGIVTESYLHGRNYQWGLQRLRLTDKHKRWGISAASGAAVGFAYSFLALQLLNLYFWIVTRDGQPVWENLLFAVPAIALIKYVAELLTVGNSGQNATIALECVVMADITIQPGSPADRLIKAGGKSRWWQFWKR